MAFHVELLNIAVGTQDLLAIEYNVAFLNSGTTICRTDIDIVIAEYGAARLRLLSLKARPSAQCHRSACIPVVSGRRVDISANCSGDGRDVPRPEN